MTPYLAITLTDMELDYVGSIPTNYHSRTRLPGYERLPETTATLRLESDSPGFKGNVQYPPAWITFAEKVLNEGDPARGRYLFRRDGGIQNSDTKGRMEQVICEGTVVRVTRESGNKCYLESFHINEVPPTARNTSDPRIQRITVVNDFDQLTRSTKDNVYFPIMARAGEELWIDKRYLRSLAPTPTEKVFSQSTVVVTVHRDKTITTVKK